MSELPIVTIVLGTYNRKSFLMKTVQSIRNSDCDFKYEIIIVDGGSNDGSIEWLLKQKDIITIVQHNRGTWNNRPIKKQSWGFFMNLAFKAASSKYVLMISDDCLLHSDAIKNGIKFFENQQSKGIKMGAVPFYWRNWPEMKNYWVGRVFGDVFNVNHGLYLASALKDINYINEKDYQFYCADGDLCLKLHSAGYTIVPCIEAFVEHYIHANEKLRSQNDLLAAADCKMFEDKWGHLGKCQKGDWEYLDAPERSQSRLAEDNWSTGKITDALTRLLTRK